MNFWEVFGVGVIVGTALGIWIAYFLIRIGEWRRNRDACSESS